MCVFCRFKLKYHPEDSAKRREEQRSALKRRIEVYQKFLADGKIDSVTVDQDQSDSMVRLLDSVVILLEGGTDFDLQAGFIFQRRTHKSLFIYGNPNRQLSIATGCF